MFGACQNGTTEWWACAWFSNAGESNEDFIVVKNFGTGPDADAWIDKLWRHITGPLAQLGYIDARTGDLT